MTDWLFWATLVAALACGLLAGVFFTFSCFAMRALDALPPQSAAAAMQSINRVILRSLFLPLFLGTALLGALLAAAALLDWQQPGSTWRLAGASLYLLGGLLVTLVANVPLNRRLEQLPDAEAAAFWPGYLARWQPWNHVRSLTVLAAAAAFTLAL